MNRIILRFISTAIFTFLVGCGIDLHGTYVGNIEGKNITIQFQKDGGASIVGYFPDELMGNWVEEKTFGEPEIWVTFDGPEEKPFRLRFEFKPEEGSFLLKGIKARPMGKGMKLNPVELKGTPLFKPLN